MDVVSHGIDYDWMLLFIVHESVVSTVIIRGSSENIMDDIERSIDDGVNTYKALTKVWLFLRTVLWLYVAILWMGICIILM